MNDLKSYRVLEGVETVDGQRVPDDRIVRLSDLAAWFDLNAGKIVPLDDEKAKPAKPEPAVAAKGKSPADG